MRSARRYAYSSSLRLIPTLIFLLLVAAVGLRAMLLYKDSRFSKFDRFNVVLIAKPMALLSVDGQNRTVTEVRFSDELYIPDLAYGYGGYRASAIYAVGELDKRGAETVAETVSDFLGVPVDGYIYEMASLPIDVKSFFLSLTVFSSRSNLNLLDRVWLALAVLQTRFDKIKVIDLASFAEPLILTDGSTALSLDKEVLDNRLAGSFIEGRIRDEALRLEVNNSTKVTGLGNRAGRLLTNIGVNVISVGSTDVPMSNCQVQVTQKARGSVTVARVAAIFSCQVLPNMEEGRSEVVMTLGLDYAKKLGK